ncbi:MAG: hypothetical protein KDC97_02340 [Confluentibacter sp.]|nr:hypothetical protein [Confluentibacter sp.]
MKPLYKKIVLTFILALSFFTNAQINTGNKTRLNSVNNSKLESSAITKKLSIKDLNNVIPNKTELLKTTKISLPSKEELERNRIKKWEATPKKPFTSGFGCSFYGRLEEAEFVVMPRPNENGFYLFSGFLNTSIISGKNYVLTLEMNPFSAVGFEIVLEIGNDRFRIILNPNQQKYVLPFQFTSEKDWATYNNIVFSPAMNLNRTGTSVDMKPISIKRILLEEVE